MSMAKICQIFSGSSGNSIFISDSKTKILVDAGVTAKRLEIGLNYIGEDASELSAIFITHEHYDHVKGLRVLASRHGIPVYTGKKIMERLYADERVNESVPTALISENMELGGIEVVPFELSHDSVECYGYRFNLKNGRSVSVCTDTGYVTAQAKAVIPGSDFVFLESNHEVTMLENGPYPYILKQRILSRKGHLSNEACADFARELVKSGTRWLNLSHISRENNLPEIARQTVIAALAGDGLKNGFDYKLSVSKPENDERAIII